MNYPCSSVAERGSLEFRVVGSIPTTGTIKGVEMNKEDIEVAEDLFNTTSIILAERGEISPIYFIIKHNILNPVVAYPGITVQQLANLTVDIAHDADAEAVIFICEQWMVEMNKSSEELKDYLDGSKRPSESADAKLYLTLTYMTKYGVADSLIAKIHMSTNGIRYIRESKWVNNTSTNMITPWAV